MPNDSQIQISKLHVEGFKSYVTLQTIEFSPLTLFFGSNASGKSTAIQILRWLGANALPDVAQPELSGIIRDIDLGNFRNIVSSHDEARGILIEIEARESTEFEAPDFKVKWRIESGSATSAGRIKELWILDAADSGILLRASETALQRSTHQVFVVENGVPLPARGDITASFLGIRLLCRGNIGLIAEQEEKYKLLLQYLRRYQFVPPHRDQLPRVILSTDLQRNEYLGGTKIGVVSDWSREVLRVARTPRRLENVNFHLSQLDVPYQLKFVEVPLDGLSQIALSTRPLIPYFVDRDTGVEVFARDIGYGVSQVLPVIIACAGGGAKTHVMVEQPELHLHPRVQSRLADLFFSAINNGIQISVETHSEHLIYRAQRLIRERKVQPEDISVNYIERTRQGSVVHKLRIADSGNFLDVWPGGFFDERLEELL